MSALAEFLRGLRAGPKDFGDSISIIINSIMFTVVYILGVGIIFIFAKILRKNFLDLKVDKQAESYWKELNLTKKQRESYYRQF